MVPILSQLNPVYNSQTSFSKIHYNIIIPSTPSSFPMASSLHALWPKFWMYFSSPIAQLLQRWATGWTIGVLGFDSRRELEIFLLPTASRPALGPTQHPIQWVPGALSLGVKPPGREADHSLPCSAEVKECVELYFHSPDALSWGGAQLKKSTGTNLPLYIYIYMCVSL
jgi:hypothetical protein